MVGRDAVPAGVAHAAMSPGGAGATGRGTTGPPVRPRERPTPPDTAMARRKTRTHPSLMRQTRRFRVARRDPGRSGEIRNMRLSARHPPRSGDGEEKATGEPPRPAKNRGPRRFGRLTIE